MSRVRGMVVTTFALFGAPAWAIAATLSAGFDHNAAVINPGAAGQVWSWGGNTGGKLGNNATTNSALPVRAGTLSGATSVATGMSYTLAVSGGNVYSWGLNDNGQLGIGAVSPHTCNNPFSNPCARTPQLVGGLTSVVAVGAGWGHSVALKGDGTVYAWGSNQNNSLAVIGGSTNIPVQVPGVTGITKIAVGYFHTIALKSDGSLVAWGHNFLGELGNGFTTGTTAVVTVLGHNAANPVLDISSRGGFTLALKQDGTVWMWGSAIYGQKGDGTAPVSAISTPQQVPVLAGVAEISAGYAHALARKGDGTVWGWGLNQSGQLGVATADLCGSSTNLACSRSVIALTARDGATALGAGAAHTLTLRPGGAIVAFGDNDAGQLGNQSANYGPPYTFSNNIYDPSGTLFPTGTFGSGGSVGTGSTSGDLNIGSLDVGVQFATRAVNTSSSTSPVTLENLSSSSPIGISGIGTSGDFSKSDDCGSSLAALATCTVNITFTPTGSGQRAGTLSINTDLTDSPTLSVTLEGDGVAAPNAPTGVGATAGDRQASVSFTPVPPANNGGSPITSYTATSSPGNISASNASTPITVGGLTNGTSYTFTVRASNAYLTSAASGASGAVVPQATTTTTVSSNGTPSAAGASVTFTATIAASFGTATGTVNFKDGGTTIAGCSAQTVSAGSATCSTSALASGVHSITGVYSGAAAFAGSTSAAFMQTVNANYTLTVTRSGAGTGTVASVPAGINCGATCSASFASGTSVTLTATASAGFVFLRWTGCDAPTANQCAVTMNAARTVNAQFGYAEVGRRDMNSDGFADLLWRNSADGSVQGWLMNGLTATQIAGLLPAGGYSVTHVGDLDGDGKADLLIRHTDGTVIGWLMNGLSVSAQTTFVGAGSGWSIVKVADLNGDGKADLIWQHTDGTVQAWLMNGLSVSSTATFVGAGSGWNVSQVMDLDGDGKSDILWQHANGTVQAWLMNGLTVASIASYAPAGSGWSVVLTGDFNGDGKADLFWQHTDGSSQAWLMNGLAVAQVASFTPAGTGWSPILAGDLDGDGKADLFWQHTSGASQTWMMNGLSVSNLASFVPGGTGWTATHLLDLNGDGRKDVLWKHTSGAVQAWLMNGLTISQIGSLAGAGSYSVVPAP